MSRAALYAYEPHEVQHGTSLEEQLRKCERHVEQVGWTVAGRYHDAAVASDSMILRPGLQSLLADARAGAFDVVVTDSLGCLARDEADSHELFKHLRSARVRIVTLAEGELGELHVGLGDLAAKTHRGLRRRVEAGRSGGGLGYGYDIVKAIDAAGERARGDRRINEVEAEVVRRVFREFASGVSPRAIARRLNDDGILGPSGKGWTDSTIRGQVKRGAGLLNNELYVGRLVWNRLHMVKSPETGRRVSRVNRREDWIVTEVPELRIVDDALWQAVKDRQAKLSEKLAAAVETPDKMRANGLNATHRPRHLLSGLLECGVCGGPYTMRGQDRYACSNHVTNRSCSNGRSIRRIVLEDRVLTGLKDRLLAPTALATAVRACLERTDGLNYERRASRNQTSTRSPIRTAIWSRVSPRPCARSKEVPLQHLSSGVWSSE